MLEVNDVVDFKGDASHAGYNNTRIVMIDSLGRALIVHPKGTLGSAIVQHQLNPKHSYCWVFLADLILSDGNSKYPKDLLISAAPVPNVSIDAAEEGNEEHVAQMKKDQKKINKFLDQVIDRGILKEGDDKVLYYIVPAEQEGGEPFKMVFVNRENLANYFYNTPEHLAFLHQVVEVLDGAEGENFEEVPTVDPDYLDKLSAMKGIGKKRAKAIVVDYPVEQNLIDAIASGEKKLTSDKDVNKILLAAYK